MTACDLARSANPGWRTHGWTLRAYQPGDESQIVSLFQTCFHHRITEAHWRWKLRGYEARFDNVWVAESDGRIIGHFAAIPVRVWLNGAEHCAMIAVDPTFRKSAGRFPGIFWDELAAVGFRG
jgi:predicted N-acetyltransferase YhbS